MIFVFHILRVWGLLIQLWWKIFLLVSFIFLKRVIGCCMLRMEFFGRGSFSGGWISGWNRLGNLMLVWQSMSSGRSNDPPGRNLESFPPLRDHSSVKSFPSDTEVLARSENLGFVINLFYFTITTTTFAGRKIISDLNKATHVCVILFRELNLYWLR